MAARWSGSRLRRHAGMRYALLNPILEELARGGKISQFVLRTDILHGRSSKRESASNTAGSVSIPGSYVSRHLGDIRDADIEASTRDILHHFT
jgi:hypothetical protein